MKGGGGGGHNAVVWAAHLWRPWACWVGFFLVPLSSFVFTGIQQVYEDFMPALAAFESKRLNLLDIDESATRWLCIFIAAPPWQTFTRTQQQASTHSPVLYHGLLSQFPHPPPLIVLLLTSCFSSRPAPSFCLLVSCRTHAATQHLRLLLLHQQPQKMWTSLTKSFLSCG